MWVAILEDDSLFGSVAARQPGEEEEEEEEDEAEEGGEEEEQEEGREGAEREFLRGRAGEVAKGKEEKDAAAAAGASSAPAAPALPVGKGEKGDDERSSGGNGDAWEMVQGSSSLYPASSESRLQKKEGAGGEKKAGLRPGGTEEDRSRRRHSRRQRRSHGKTKGPKSLSARVLAAVDACPWPLSTEYAETGKYNRLVSAPFPPGDDTDDAVGRDIGRTFPEHPQVDFLLFLCGLRALFFSAFHLTNNLSLSLYFFL